MSFPEPLMLFHASGSADLTYRSALVAAVRDGISQRLGHLEARRVHLGNNNRISWTASQR